MRATSSELAVWRQRIDAREREHRAHGSIDIEMYGALEAERWHTIDMEARVRELAAHRRETDMKHVVISSRPRLLDLFCGAGGAGMGYHRAGFDVVGVDIAPQPNYPFEFHQADAILYLAEHGREFDLIHASPPCQRYSAMSNCRPGLADDYPDMIPVTRAVLKLAGVPWVIENVPGSTVRPDLILCGHMFGLKLYRHRLFELSTGPAFGMQPDHPRHTTPGSRAGHWEPGTIISVSGNCSPIAVAREAMGIDWMPRSELAESIPPAYTEHIGGQILNGMKVVAG